jgi:hypothetical protein
MDGKSLARSRVMMRASVTIATVLALLLPASIAAADDGDKDFGLVGVEGFVTMMNMQNLTLNSDSTPRRIVGIAAPSGGQFLVGGGIAAQVRYDYFHWDIIGVRVATGVGGGLGGTTTLDGGPVSMGLGPTSLLEVSFPWFGIPNGFQLFPSYNWKIATKLEWGMEHITADATVTGATYRGVAASIDDWDFFFKMQIAGCRRLSQVGDFSTRWACVAASPVFYEKGAFPGISLGFRVDL